MLRSHHLYCMYMYIAIQHRWWDLNIKPPISIDYIDLLQQALATCGTRAKRGTILNGTLSEMKYSNYDLIKNWIFN